MIRRSICILAAFAVTPAAHASAPTTAPDWVPVPDLDGNFCVDRASIQSGQAVTFIWKRCDAAPATAEQDKLDCSQDPAKEMVMYYRPGDSEEWKSDQYQPGEPGAVIARYVCGLADKAR
jgi:hypothetical protein